MMRPQVDIYYAYQSGFAVRLPQTLLLFDVVPTPPPFERHDLHELIRDAPRCHVFVSHAHSDHFDPGIFDWSLKPGSEYILSSDVHAPRDARMMRPGDALELPGARVRAYGSTDQGVSFLVECEGIRVFHAGDLNLWHWPDESTREEILAAQVAFDAEIDKLRGEVIDIAFFPVDPRMGQDHARGARGFVRALHPAVFVPMHFGADADAARSFRELTNARDTVVMDMRPGTRACLESDPVLFAEGAGEMNFFFAHNNFNVFDMDKSIGFYERALGLTVSRRHKAGDGSFEIAFLTDGSSKHLLELTWLRDREQPYELGDNEIHLCFTVDDYAAAHARHAEMGVICYENEAMGLYFIEDPDGYWLEIVPARR